MITTNTPARRRTSPLSRIKKSRQLYLLFALPFLYVALFYYGPMYGVQIAFKRYNVLDGITGSPWAGLYHFRRFFNSYDFPMIVRNTITLSLYSMLAGMPVPIILAISLNECQFPRYKKLVQTVTYAPHFISMVVMVSMLIMFLSPSSGFINNTIAFFGGERINFMGEPGMFKTIYVLSGIWQGMGYSSIIYLAALTGIDSSLYEAAFIDGATRLQKIWYIDLPSIVPTITIMFILSMGSIMNVGFEKVYLMQNSLNRSSSEIIATFVYKQGIESGKFDYSAAVSLFNSVINMVMIVTVNQVARKVGETSLW